MDLEEIVYKYPTKYKEGFIVKEYQELLKKFPNINMDKFNNALCGITCMVIDGQTISYHCDILTALRCGIEDRDMYLHEWD